MRSIHSVFYFVQCNLKLFEFLFLETNAMGEKQVVKTIWQLSPNVG